MRLNLFDYRLSAVIANRDEPFAALIAAAMRRADGENAARLAIVFPEIEADLRNRYYAPGGELPGDRPPQLMVENENEN